MGSVTESFLFDSTPIRMMPTREEKKSLKPHQSMAKKDDGKINDTHDREKKTQKTNLISYEYYVHDTCIYI